MRKTLLAVAIAALALTACGGGLTAGDVPAPPTTVAITTVDSTPSGAVEDEEAARVVTSLCDEYCEQLKQGGTPGCPEPLNDLKVCADYLTPLVSP